MAGGTLKLNGALKLGRLASAPSDLASGLIYYDTTASEFRFYNGSTLVQVADFGQLGTTGASSGASKIGTGTSWTNFTPSANNVEKALEAIDSALGAVSSSTPLDSVFRIENAGDPTKKIAFTAAGISTATTRTITMPDFNVDLGNLTNSNISASAAIAYSKLALSNSIVNADIASAAAIALNKLAALSSHNRALQSDASGFVSESSVTSTELGYVSGVTSAIQTQLNGKINASGSIAFTGNQSMGGFNLTNLADPVSAQDAVTKSYADAVSVGARTKNNVAVATTANINLASAPSTIDGYTLLAGDRVLVKNQTDPKQNGVYDWASAGAAMTRSADLDNTPTGEIYNGVLVPRVENGATFQYQSFVISSIGTGAGGLHTIGTDSITWTTFATPGTLIAGNGISITGGTTINVLYDNVTIDLTSNQLEVKAGGISNSHINASAAIAYSKLALSNSIVNADINSSAAIAYSKLALTGAIINADINASAAIAYSKLALSNSIVNADINSAAAIAYSKLALSNSIVNADIAAGAAIAYSKLSLSASIVNADIAAGAAISLSKLAALTNHNRALQSDGSGFVSESAVTSTELGYVSGVTSSIQTQINNKLSSVSQDTTPTLGGNLSLGGFSLISPFQIADSGSTSRFFTEKYIDSTTLTASTTAVAANFTFDSRNFKGAQIFYTILSGTDRRIGRLDIICDAASGSASANVDLTDVSNETADVGVTWSAAVSGNNIQVSYTTNAGTKTMRALMRTFQA